MKHEREKYDAAPCPTGTAFVKDGDRSIFVSLTAEMLADGRSVRFPASGRSMLPAIHDGDFLTVAPLARARIAPGSVVLYRNTNGVTAHRVLAMGGRGGQRILHVRGDASRATIEKIAWADVLGVVTCAEHQGRKVRVDTVARRTVGLVRAGIGTWRARLGRLLRR